MPKISVITASFGKRVGQDEEPYERYLYQMRDSVRKQTFRDFEHIIEKAKEPTSVNLNNAIRRAKGEYIKFIADDDMLTENCLQDLYDGIQGYDWVCANAKFFGEIVGLYKSKPGTVASLCAHNTIHGATTMYRKDVLLAAQLGDGEVFDEELVCAEEFELHLRLLSMGFKLGYVDKVVAMNRIHFLQKSNGGMCQGLRAEQKLDIINRYETG